MANQPLTAAELAAYDLKDRPFLHQQGMTLCRGFVTGFTVEGAHWVLSLRDVEIFDPRCEGWSLRRSEDEFIGLIDDDWRAEKDEDGVIDLPGYGMETFIGPKSDAPWSRIDWPETDSYPGGAME